MNVRRWCRIPLQPSAVCKVVNAELVDLDAARFGFLLKPQCSQAQITTFTTVLFVFMFTSSKQVVGYVIEVLLPALFAAFVLLRPSMPRWAKGLAIGSAIMALGAAILSFLLSDYRRFGLTSHDYIILMRLKTSLIGVVAGIIISLSVAFGRVKSFGDRKYSAPESIDRT